MKTVRFGRTGVPVSELCFGTMSFGDQADASEAKNLYAACRKAGVTFFDCANVYSNGPAEEILGSLTRLLEWDIDSLKKPEKGSL